jgi:hypothetical protein
MLFQPATESSIHKKGPGGTFKSPPGFVSLAAGGATAAVAAAGRTACGGLAATTVARTTRRRPSGGRQQPGNQQCAKQDHFLHVFYLLSRGGLGLPWAATPAHGKS